MDDALIITIDGPSGAGKSTVARMLADDLGYAYIDTGAMYRGVAYAYRAMETRGKFRVKEAVESKRGMEMFLKNLPLRFEFGETARVFLDGKDISGEIRTPEISLLASKLSQDQDVREFLTSKQREYGIKGGVVMEGRDTGSVVFPNAHLKFYLDAHEEERARRRYLDLSAGDTDADPARIRKEMTKRDKDDSERHIAPLVVPPGAIIIDSMGIDARGVVNVMMTYIKERGRYGSP